VNLRQGWREQSQAWAAWARTPGHDQFYWRFNLPRFLEIVPSPGRATADIGCGEGRLARALSDRGHRVVGVDASPALAVLAATHADPVTTAVADAAALPLRDASVDLAIAFMVLQDVDRLDESVAEVARILTPDGHLCLAIIHPIASAGGFADADDATSAFVVDRPYSESTMLSERFERDGLTMVFHSVHRPIGAYFDALERAGFVVETLREPVPDEELVHDEPRMNRQRRIPWYLHIRARRVAPDSSTT
jgi:SAM-dependent methyltransferase